MRKFKHKITGEEVKESEKFENLFFLDYGQSIPTRFIVGSSDWEEIKKTKIPLFTTEDGVDIFEGDQFIELYEADMKYGITNSFSDDSRKVLRFAKQKNAEKYIQLNKPQYSIKDIVPIVNNWSLFPCIDENDILNFLEKNKNTKN